MKLLLNLSQPEHQPQHSILIPRTGNPESSDLSGVLYVVASAEAFIVVADFHNPDGVGGIVWKALHVETVLHFFLSGVFDGNW